MADSPHRPRTIRGERPHFFDDPAIDTLFGIVTALAQEVSVLRDRHDAVERILDAKGSMTREELESYRPDEAADAERRAAREAYLQRIFRLIRREGGAYGSASSEGFVSELAETLSDEPR